MNDQTQLRIDAQIAIPLPEIEITAIRAQGAGGQNVNKVSNAVHLRFDVRASSLPVEQRERVLALRDARITQEGVVIIKAQRYRSLEQNRDDALARLRDLIVRAITVQKKRTPTKPTRGSQQRRVEGKVHRGKIKSGRGRIKSDDN